MADKSSRTGIALADCHGILGSETPSTIESGNGKCQDLTQASYTKCLGDPSALAMGCFATTLLTVSMSLMGLRGVEVEQVHVGNLCFAAGMGLLISAQWEIVRGHTFSYTVLSAFGFFYGGYGALMIPWFGLVDAYGGHTPAYYNAMGFFILIWAVFNLFFLLASLPKNLVYILIFVTVEFCLIFDASSHFAQGDGKAPQAKSLKRVGGAFGFCASLLGYYATAHYLCEEDLPITFPMGNTSRILGRQKR